VTEREQSPGHATKAPARAARGKPAQKEAAGIAARRVALEILIRVSEKSAWADVLLGERLAGFDERDRRLITMLVLGTLAWRGRLDHEIACLVSPGAGKLDAAVREIIRMALFQVRFLSRVPKHAAVDTAVRLARADPRSRNAAGLINAVMRRAVRDGEVGMPARSRDEAGYLAVKWSHPRWLVERFIQWFGAAGAEELMAANNQAAPTVLRLNLARGAPEAIIERLEAEGTRVSRAGLFPETVLLEGAPRTDSESFRAGLFHVQSEASQIVSRLLAPARASAVLDCAAAPGGKSTHLAELVGQQGFVLALDLRLQGLRNAREVARRLGHRNVLFACADVTRGVPLKSESFDFVLLDAPCTGTGTLREHPELRWRLRPDDFARMAAVQVGMLASAAAMVRPGGAIVYSVCSLAPEEGEGVIASFLGGHPEFALDRRPPASEKLRDVMREDGTMLTRPDRGGLDGFFAARMTRR
jgi:16S rRNA (cytosine967-C5)-methyltransferase